MEKIRALLYDKKQKVPENYFDGSEEGSLNRHNNVYQANFLAKVNDIAIRRGIKQES